MTGQGALKERRDDPGVNRDLDPDVRQRRASDPADSVWVGASAGTGKTKVLTDRVLRLLLQKSAPHRILCLTFTKAAASEMALRIHRILSEWAVMCDADLLESLEKLAGKPPSEQEQTTARQLFATITDTPGGLPIMTIHSFCQSVLRRFPLEAGLPPHFTVIEETAARALLGQARDRFLKAGDADALRPLASALNEEQFNRTLDELCSEREQLLKTDDSAPLLHKRLCKTLGIAPDDDETGLLKAACADSGFDRAAIYKLSQALAHGAKGDQERGVRIQAWLESDPATRLENFENYKYRILTKTTGAAKKLTAGTKKYDPDCEQSLETEAARLLALEAHIRAVRCAALTRDLMMLGRMILLDYQALKEKHAVLDYDDLVIRTLALLSRPGLSSWVLFKLDGGLDHILIDEAQDTNPEQWQIIEKLCDDFFAGYGARAEDDGITRTLFTVGDEKQSIYSFQRAAPEKFTAMRESFSRKINESGQALKDETLNISFRSTETVLRLVDAVFADREMKHYSHRRGQAGLAELWPLFETPAAAPEEPWSPPLRVRESTNGQALLAEYIGGKIKGWLESGEILESQGRAIEPGDIMILMRTRTAFVNQLVRALKTRNIPVSGIDRMVLGDQLPVMDLLAMAQFGLLPEDDLTLACVLKSPLLGGDENDLYDIAVDRSKVESLWKVVKEKADPEIVSYLNNLINRAAADHPYEFFSHILQRPCPGDRISGLRAMTGRLGNDILDPLDEFLNAALNFERDHIPALQNFLAWQQKGDITIKREQEEAGSAVRIMTIHGAKGLQSPIVILPDTTRTHTARRMPRLLWPDKSGLDVPLWSPRKDCDAAVYEANRDIVANRLDEEYERLLYVALTRAEDRLYIGGYKGKRPPLADSWYNRISAAFARMEDVTEHSPGKDGSPAGVFRISNPQTRDPDGKTGKETAETASIPAPSWSTKPAPAEPQPPRPLVPSRPLVPEPAMRSPLADTQGYRFRRGNLTHTLLQILPDLSAVKRRKAAAYFLARPGHDLPKDVQAGIVAETLAILENPDFAPLFGEGSRAEIPVTGLVAGRLVSGQIDRLLVRDDSVWIVDYKTNRPPPHREEDIPASYRQQMNAYRDIMAAIYPDHIIRCFLLWTDGPFMMSLA